MHVINRRYYKRRFAESITVPAGVKHKIKSYRAYMINYRILKKVVYAALCSLGVQFKACQAEDKE